MGGMSGFALASIAVASVSGLLAVAPAVKEALSDGQSLRRERGAYALGRTYDPASYIERGLVDRAFLSGSGAERAAALRGLCDRSFPEGLPTQVRRRIDEALEEKDPSVVAAGAECLDRLSPEAALPVLTKALESATSRGLGAPTTMSLLLAAGRLPCRPAPVVPGASNADPCAKLQEAALEAGRWLGVRLDGKPARIDGVRARVLAVLAANGVDVEAALAEEMVEATGPGPALVARKNRVRAGAGDAAALSALVETANVAADLHLRREAMDLLSSLPRERRVRTYRALEPRLGDFDGGVRARLVRGLSRDALADDPVVERMLRKALEDGYADLRLEAAAGLHDRAAAGLLSDEAKADVREARARESDSLVEAVLGAALERAPATTR